MALPNRIDELRKAQGLSNRDLARAVGVHEATVSRWCSGQLTPGVGTVLKLARALGVSVDALLREPTDPPEDPHSAAIASVKRMARTLGVDVSELREDPSTPVLAGTDAPERCMVVRDGARCLLVRHGGDREHTFAATAVGL